MTGAVTRQHSSVRRYRDLARSIGGDARERELLLDGVHLLEEARLSGLAIDTAAFDHAILDQPAVRSLAEALSAAGTEVMIVSRNVLEAMSPVKTPSGAVGIARRPLSSPADALAGAKPALAMLACDVQDPGNVGALIRTAEAAGATAFVACGASADPYGWKALRGSMGSALRLVIARSSVEEALGACGAAGVQTIALATRGGRPFFEADFRKPTALFVGSEGAGLPVAVSARADCQVTIPMARPVESLNVGVAAGLVIYEAFRQRLS